MNKETLGQYGWVVICVIVLAIMITFATPFGNKIAGEVVETVTNMTSSANTALDEISVGGYDGGVGGGAGGAGGTEEDEDENWEELTLADLYAAGEIDVSSDMDDATFTDNSFSTFNGSFTLNLPGYYEIEFDHYLDSLAFCEVLIDGEQLYYFEGEGLGYTEHGEGHLEKGQKYYKGEVSGGVQVNIEACQIDFVTLKKLAD